MKYTGVTGSDKQPIRVLVVDDLAFMREAIRDALSETEIQVIGEAQNGRDALTMYQTAKPDVVLLDIAMPHMDGITALGKLMRIDPAARVVMCSAMDEQRLIIRAIQLGARDFVVKPFRPERIVSAVRKAGGHRERI
ncbi:MAG: response regulator [Spirochaetaceae bacterium]|nr:MAG: response regulator [Spirochaetaceae bacterium]